MEQGSGRRGEESPMEIGAWVRQTMKGASERAGEAGI
jgi:hypothetical protein